MIMKKVFKIIILFALLFTVNNIKAQEANYTATTFRVYDSSKNTTKTYYANIKFYISLDDNEAVLDCPNNSLYQEFNIIKSGAENNMILLVLKDKKGIENSKPIGTRIDLE